MRRPIYDNIFDLNIEGDTFPLQSMGALGRENEVKEYIESTTTTQFNLTGNVSIPDINMEYVPPWFTDHVKNNVAPVQGQRQGKNIQRLTRSTPTRGDKYSKTSRQARTKIRTDSSWDETDTFPPNFFFSIMINDGEELDHVRSVENIGAEFSTKEHLASDAMAPKKLADNRDFNEVTITLVSYDKKQLYDWVNKTGGFGGQVSEIEYQDFRVTVNNRAGEGLMHWDLYGCWPTGYTTTSLDAGGEDVLLEEVTIQPSYIEVGASSNTLSDYAYTIFDTPARKRLVVNIYSRGEEDPSREVILLDTWPKTYSISALDASDDGFLTESLNLSVGGIEFR